MKFVEWMPMLSTGKNNGLEFIDAVQTATKKYLIKHLSSKGIANRGDLASVLGNFSTVVPVMMAVIGQDADYWYFSIFHFLYSERCTTESNSLEID